MLITTFAVFLSCLDISARVWISLALCDSKYSNINCASIIQLNVWASLNLNNYDNSLTYRHGSCSENGQALLSVSDFHRDCLCPPSC